MSTQDNEAEDLGEGVEKTIARAREGDSLVDLDAPADEEEEEPEEEAPPSSVEDIAKAAGWKPKDQWKGSGWTPAAEFIAHRLDKGAKNQRKLGEVHDQVRLLSERLSKSEQVEFDKRLAEAVEADDFAKVKKLVEEAKASGDKQTSTDLTAFEDFKERNDWFGVHSGASDYAAVVGRRLAKQGMQEGEESYAEIEKAVRAKFPLLFDEEEPVTEPKEDKKKGQPFAHGASRVTKPQSKTPTASTLTAEQRKAAEEMGVSLESYAKSLAKLQEKDKAA